MCTILTVQHDTESATGHESLSLLVDMTDTAAAAVAGSPVYALWSRLCAHRASNSKLKRYNDS